MKICVNKRVSWYAAGRRISGKVIQVIGDHVKVESEGMSYIVPKSVVAVDPEGSKGAWRTGTTS